MNYDREQRLIEISGIPGSGKSSTLRALGTTRIGQGNNVGFSDRINGGSGKNRTLNRFRFFLYWSLRLVTLLKIIFSLKQRFNWFYNDSHKQSLTRLFNRFLKVLKLIVIPIFLARDHRYFIFEGVTHLILNDVDLDAEGFHKFFCSVYGVERFYIIFVEVSADESFKRMVNRGDKIDGDGGLLVNKYRKASEIQRKLLYSLDELNRKSSASVLICHLNGNKSPEQNKVDLETWLSENVIF